MTVEYVDAGEAIDQGRLSGKIAGGEVAPPVVQNVDYERILQRPRRSPRTGSPTTAPTTGSGTARWTRSTRRTSSASVPAWVFQAGSSGLIAGASTYSFEAAPIVVDGVMFLSGWDGWVLGPRREDGHGDLAVQARRPLRRVPVLREREPRGRRGQGEGLLRHRERPCARARRHHRQAGLGPDLRRRAGRGERHGRAAGREEHGHRRELRRRVRGARPPRRVRHRLRRAPVALLHGPEARGTRLRDLARRRRGLGSGVARTAGSPAPSTRRRTCCTWAPATRRPTSTERSARATTSTPTASSPSTSTPARSAGTTSAPRTTCGTTTASASASCSSRTGASCSGTSTRTATSSSWTARTGNGSRSRPSWTGSPGERSPGTAR